MTPFNLGWWSCFISMYYESIGTIMGEEKSTMLINVANDARVTKKEIDEIIKFYGEDALDEEVLNFLKRLKMFIKYE